MKNIFSLIGVIGLVYFAYEVGKATQKEADRAEFAKRVNLQAEIKEFMESSSKEDMVESLDRLYTKLYSN